jgi:hypothetical protein
LFFEWPKRITQVKFIVLFSSRRHGGRTRRLCGADLMRGRPIKPHTSARRAPRRGANGCADVRFLTCAAVQPLIFRPEAALGSGFSLQAAFWYQNAMLALFLCSKKSQSVVRFSFRLEEFFAFHFVQAIKSKISAFRISQSLH